jgi:carboxylesterase type B
MAAIRAGRGAVPILAGANRDDASAFIAIPEAAGSFASYLGTVGQSAHAASLAALYPPSQLGERGAAIAYATDVAFACPAQALAQVRPQTSRLYELERPIASGRLVGLGAVHGLDYLFLFGTFSAWGIDPAPERALSTAIQRLWGAVAAGQPLAIWPTVPAVLQLDTASTISTTWRANRCAALTALGIVTE